jgi:hypothetical protein
LAAVEAACAEALADGVHSADVVLNILSRRRDPGPVATILTPDALRLSGVFFSIKREGLSASFRAQDRATDDFTLKGALSGLPPSGEIEHLVGVHPISGLDDVARFGVVHASAVSHLEPHGPACRR